MQDNSVFQGFVANLAQYQKGKLHGEWVSFPTDKRKMEDVFTRLGITQQENVFVAEYKSEQNQGLANYLKPFANLDEVNYFAELLDFLDEKEKGLVLMVVEWERLDDIYQYINVIHNVDKYQLIPNIYNPASLKEYTKRHPDEVTSKIHLGAFCDIGYIYETGEIEMIYDGNRDAIPKNCRVYAQWEPFQQKNLPKDTQDKIKKLLENSPKVEGFHAYIANSVALQENEIKGEWVSLPTDLEAIQELFERIELNNPFEYTCLSVQSDVKGLGEKIDTTIHLDLLNYMAEEMERLEYSDDDSLAIFESCLEAYKVNGGTDILNLIENTDCFRLAQDKHSMQEVANKYMGEMKLPKSLSSHIHIDIPSAEKEIKRDEAAYYTKNGFLERLRLPTEYYKSLEDIPDRSRIVPVIKEISREEVKKSLLATLENAKDASESTKQNKKTKRDIER
ncbi:hypothetical protein BMT55_08280 [Listeria newyorkensis]|uniref:Antirestriction protein (ArdA) n=1 Tax=Listeria newyorkensis TaxID=1497681 RepID=A0ABX4XN59_9LIST|nr:antirestriction protein ArdA [Listeria newyorkensis]PNP92556.1 hypothetical protein BMT55_08280 [Listeria newyorkensis]